MVAAALAFALPGRLGRCPAAPRTSRDSINAAICRTEVAELDRQRANDALTDAEYARAREDAERRLLADVPADVAAGAAGEPMLPPRAVAIGTAMALPALAFGLYALVGNPGSLSNARLDTAAAPTAVQDPAAVRDDLVRHLARKPKDGRAWVLLARADFDADRYADAVQAYAKALAVSPRIAADAGVLCEYADALGMAQGGTLAGRPLELVQRALALDPEHPKALELAGSAAYEQRDYAAAAQHWRRLLPRLADGSREQRELAAAVERVARLAPARIAPEVVK